MNSKILVIADASIHGLNQVLGTVEKIHCAQMRMRILFISPLNGPFIKNIGPNILGLLMKEEQDTLQRARDYFLRKDIPYDIKLISASSWKAVLEEIDAKTDDLLILQGEFATVWEKDHPPNVGLGAIPGSATPVWILKGPEESSAVPFRP
jgi:hypothetical protein